MTGEAVFSFSEADVASEVRRVADYNQTRLLEWAKADKETDLRLRLQPFESGIPPVICHKVGEQVLLLMYQSLKGEQAYVVTTPADRRYFWDFLSRPVEAEAPVRRRVVAERWTRSDYGQYVPRSAFVRPQFSRTDLVHLQPLLAYQQMPLRRSATR